MKTNQHLFYLRTTDYLQVLPQKNKSKKCSTAIEALDVIKKKLRLKPVQTEGFLKPYVEKKVAYIMKTFVKKVVNVSIFKLFGKIDFSKNCRTATKIHFVTA